MSDHDNLEEYAEPSIYDFENSAFEPDGPFYLEWAQKTVGPVLELGCGSGRITLPLARAGIQITGLDVVPGLLDIARSKAGGGAAHWVEADVRSFELEGQFPLIFTTGGVFQHLLSRPDQEAMLERVRRHLAPGGLFILDVYSPHPSHIVDVTQDQEWETYTDGQGRQVRLSGTEQYDPVRQIKHETAYRRWSGRDGRPVIRAARMAMRLIFPQEMESLLHYNGFAVERCYGGWEGDAPDSTTEQWVYLCRRLT
ncbi:MAG: methyltransferase domain-containing protein [Candidatus Latescibacteria bacterium]|nr:methyltransferase domain-containing protein [Candidatus Latescibacterota bacterium]